MSPKRPAPTRPVLIDPRVANVKPTAAASAAAEPAVRAAPSDDMIRQRAYHLWNNAGRPESDGIEYWAAAEKEMSQV